MQRLRAALVGTAVACLALPLGVAGTAVAHDDDHDDDALEVETLVTGLDSPRGLALDRRENVWFAQAGRGGDGPCIEGLGGPPAPERCLGATGKISVLREHDDDDDDRRRDRRGHHHDDDSYSVRDVVTGLPSLAPQEGAPAVTDAIGPSDVVFDRRGRLQATIGMGANPTWRTAPLGGGLAAELATVHAVDIRRGTTTRVADIGTFEAVSNPAEDDLDSNPHSIAWAHGVRYVADAGGNALLKIDRDGVVSTVHAFAPVMVPNPFDPAGPAFPADPVPNSVVRGPDGAVYVGLLTGFPFAVGAASVWRFEEGEPGEVYATGFTNIIDLAFDDDGHLLVLEIAHLGLLQAQDGDPSGALIQVSRRNPAEHTVLMTTPLVLPGGIVVDDDDAYISNQTFVAGMGEILKVELDD